MCDDATQNVLPLSRRRQGVSVLSALCGWLTPAIVESPLARSLSHAADELASYNASCRQPHRHRAAKALKKRAPFAKCFHFSGENRHILPSFSEYVGGSSLQTSSSGSTSLTCFFGQRPMGQHLCSLRGRGQNCTSGVIGLEPCLEGCQRTLGTDAGGAKQSTRTPLVDKRVEHLHVPPTVEGK